MTLPGFDNRRFPVIAPPASNLVEDDFNRADSQLDADARWNSAGAFNGFKFNVVSNRCVMAPAPTVDFADNAFVPLAQATPNFALEQLAGFTIVSYAVAGVSQLRAGIGLNGSNAGNATFFIVDVADQSCYWLEDFTPSFANTFASLETNFPGLDLSGTIDVRVERQAAGEHRVWLNDIAITPNLDRTTTFASLGTPSLYTEAGAGVAASPTITIDNFFADNV